MEALCQNLALLQDRLPNPNPYLQLILNLLPLDLMSNRINHRKLIPSLP